MKDIVTRTKRKKEFRTGRKRLGGERESERERERERDLQILTMWLIFGSELISQCIKLHHEEHQERFIGIFYLPTTDHFPNIIDDNLQIRKKRLEEDFIDDENVVTFSFDFTL